MKSRLLIFTYLLYLLSIGHSSFAASLMRIAYLENDIHHLALWIAIEEKYFDSAQIGFEIAGSFRAGSEIMTAFSAKAVDLAYIGEAPVTTGVANGAAAVKIIAQVNTGGSAIVISKNRNDIIKLSDLENKTIAIPGHSTVQDFLIRKAFASINFPLSKTNIIVIKPPEMIQALRSNQIDAFIAWQPYPAQAETTEIGKILVTSDEIWFRHPCCVLAVDENFLQNNKKIVADVVRCHVKATKFIHENPEKAIDIAVKYTGMKQETIRKALSGVNYTWELNIAGEKEYVRFLTDLQYIKPVDSEKFVKNLIDPSYLVQIISEESKNKNF
ncbi:MAG TPA: nitrate ABC transporter substrate-binding protein [Candidatus Atribacteria bacterium]|nr:nitrate ABC transporter substrate-binding protein [Candidatus Atribacteria bacterium]